MADIRITPAIGAIHVTGSAEFKGAQGSSLLFMTGSGLIGVGHTNPLSKVHVKYDQTRFLTLERTGVRSYDFGINSSKTFLITDNTEEVDRVSISLSGSVGIGTTNPTDRLYVYHSQNDSGITVYGNATNNKIALINPGMTNGKRSMRLITNSGYDGLIIQGGTNTGGFSTNVAIFEHGGNVGIGTLTPSGRLNIRAEYSSSALITSASTDYALNIDFLGVNGSISTPQYGAHFAIRDSNGAAVAAINGVDQGGSGATGLSFLTGDVNGLSDRLHITYTGNVGIGTNAPGSKLTVNGAIESLTDATGEGGQLILRGPVYRYNLDNFSGSRMRIFREDDASGGSGAELFSIASSGQLKSNLYGSGTFTGTAAYRLSVDSSGNIIEESLGAGAVDGLGSSQYIVRWQDTDTLTSSSLYEKSDGNIGLGTTNPLQTLHVSGQRILVDATNAGIMFRTGGVNRYSVASVGGAFQVYDEVNGLNRFYITSAGNAGIGTTTPASKLNVVGSADVLVVEGSGSTANTTIMAVDGNNGRLFEVSDDLSDSLFSVNTIAGLPVMEAFADNVVTLGAYNQYDLHITGSNVGIGTSAPATKLAVQAPGGDASLFSIRTSYTGNAAIVDAGQTASDGYLQVKNALGTVYSSLSGYFNTPSYFMTSVGIGTSTPSFKLHISGSGADVLALDVASTAGTTDQNAIRFLTDGNLKAQVGVAIDNARILGESVSNDFVVKSWGNILFGNESTTRVFFKNDGNVGIGTTSPGYKLQVAGNTKFDNDVYFYNTVLDPASNFATQKGAGFKASTGKFEVASSETALELSRFSTTGPVLSVRHSGSQVSYLDTDGGAWFSGDVEVGGDLTVDGIITAKEFHTTFVSASIIYQSGSTRFGNSPDDIHQFTGDLVFTADTSGTGFQMDYYDGQMYFGNGVGSSWHMVYKDDGKIGIGTITPTALLHVSSSSTEISRLDGGNTSGGYLTFANSDTVRGFVGFGGTLFTGLDNANFGVRSQGGLPLATNGGFTRMYIDTAGKVGIGTTNPAVKLHIVNSEEDTLRLQGTNNTTAIHFFSGSNRTGILGHSNGTSIATAADPGDMILRSESGKKVHLATGGGSVRMTVNAVGNVGIGTTEPATTLHVGGAVGTYNKTAALYIPTGNALMNVLYIGHGNSIGEISTDGVKDIQFQINDSTKMTITGSSGNIGIGLTNPAVKLHAVTDAANGQYRLETTHPSGIPNLELKGASSATIRFTSGSSDTIHSRIDFRKNGLYILGDGANNQLVVKDTGVVQMFDYGSGNNTGTAAYRLSVDSSGNIIEESLGAGAVDGLGSGRYIARWEDTDTLTSSSIYEDANGNIGINTTSPAQQLHIKGGFRVEDGSSASNLRMLFEDSTTFDFIIEPSTDASPNVFRFRPNSQNSAAGLRVYDRYEADYISLRHDGAAAVIETDSDGGSVYVSPQGSMVLTAAAGGNVGIGYTNPSVRLEVSGAIKLGQSSDIPVAGITHYTNGYFYIKGGASGAAMGNQDFGASIYLPNDDTVQLVAGAAERMRIDTGGNVGIRTTSPATTLHIYGPEITATSASDASPVLRLSRDINDPAFTGRKDSAVDFMVSRQQAVNNNYPFTRFDIRLSAPPTYGGADSSTPTLDVMSLRYDGRVGIGNTTPGAILDVNHPDGTTNIIRASSGSGNYRWRVDQNFDMYMTNAAGTDRLGILNDGRIYAPNLGADTDNTVVVLNSSGYLKTDEIDSRVWGSSLVDGSGNSNYMTKWSDGNTITNSQITDDGTTVTYYNSAGTLFRHGLYGSLGQRYSQWDSWLGTNTGVGQNSSADVTLLTDYTASGASTLNVGFQELAYYNWSPSALAAYNGATSVLTLPTPRFKITSDGDVGVGVSSPVSKFHAVLSNGQGTPGNFPGNVATFQTNNSTGYAAYISVIGGQTGTSGLLLGDKDAMNRGVIRYSHADEFLGLGSNGSFDRMVIASDGNVGIGNTTPSQKLDVSGNMAIGTASVASRYYIKRPSDGNQSAWFGYHTANNSDFGIRNSSGGGNIYLDSNNGALRFYNTNTSRVLFNVANNGDTTVNGDLTVSGIITAQEFHTTFVSASIVYQSGSTQFGNSNDDTHTFYGTINLKRNAGADPSPVDDPVTLRLTDAGNAATGAGDLTNPWGKIEFYSEDASSGGPGVQAQIASIYDDIYSAGSHLTFYTSTNVSNGLAEQVRITNAGRVGIGITNPAAPFHVYKSDTYSAIVSRADWNSGTPTKLALGKQYGVLGFISTDLVETTNDTTYIALNYKNGLSTYAEGLRVHNNGNVGIGTTSPEGELDINNGTADAQADWSGATLPYGTEKADLILVRRHSTNKQTGGLGFAGALIDFRATNTTNEWSTAQIATVIDPTGGGNHSGGLVFLTSGGGGTDPAGRRTQGAAPTARMVIGHNGNVGIGLTNPANTLQVAGGVTATSFTGSLQGSVTGTAASETLDTVSDRGATTNQTLTAGGFKTQGDIGVTQADGDFLVKLYQSSADGFLELYTGEATPTSRVKISSYGNSYIHPAASGKVGIGTSAPSYKLDVIGSLNINANATNGIRFTDDGSFTAMYSDSVLRLYQRLELWGGGSGRQYLDVRDQSGTPQARLDGEGVSYIKGGNLGVGTSTPATSLHVSGGFVRAEGNATDTYYYEGAKTGTGTTLRLYDNADNIYIDGWKSVNIRANQIGGSGGGVGLYGGEVTIGTINAATSDLDKFLVSDSGVVKYRTGAQVLSDIGGVSDSGDTMSGTLEIDKNNVYYPHVTSSTSQLKITAENQWIEFGTPDIGNARRAWILARHSGLPTYGGYYSTLNIQPRVNGTIADYEGVAIGYGPDFKFSAAVDLAVSGLVGIGNTAPSYKLHILDSATNGRAIQAIQSATSGTNYGAVFAAEGSGATKNVGLYANATGATTNYAAIFDNGRVGVGTTAPNAKLNLRKDTTSVDYDNFIMVSNKNSGLTEHIIGGLLFDAYRDVRDPAVVAGIWGYRKAHASGLSSAGELIFATSEGNPGNIANDSVLGPSERMRINQYGNVGIGSDSPQSILHVSAPKTTYTDSAVVFRGGTTNNNAHTGIALFSAGDALSGGVGSNYLVDGTSQSQSNTNRSTGYIRFANTTVTSNTSTVDIGGFVKGSTTDVSRLFIQGDGNVGIGTTTPAAKLEVDVTGNNNALILTRDTGTNGELRISFGGAIASYNSIQGGHKWYYNSSEKMYLDTSGNLGIGTSTPTAQLHVTGSRGAGFSAVIDNSANNGHGLYIKAGGTSGTRYITQWRDAAGNERFHMDDTGEAYFQGSVGVGTTSPGSKLVVAGEGGSTKGTDGYLVHIGGTDSNTDPVRYMIGFSHGNTYTAGNVRAAVGSLITTGGAGNLVFETGTGGAGQTERMRITGTGNVGIGSTAPEGKLNVVGGADVLIVEGSGSTANTTIMAVDGNNGRLFEVSDDLSDSLFSVNTIAGLPVMEAFADNTVTLGAYNQYDLHITGSKVGIGTSAPAYKLHVDNDTLNTNDPALYVRNPNSSAAAVIAEFVGDSDSIQIKNINVGDYVIYNTQQSNGIALYDGTGGVEIHYAGATRLEADSAGGIKVTGELSATADVVAYSSDERLKENIKPIENAVDKVKQMRGVTFDWNEKSEELGFEPTSKTNDVGVIAQEVEKVFPQLIAHAPFDRGTDEEGNVISKSGEDYKTVNYSRLTAVLIEAIKEQQTQIDELKQEIKKLKG